MIDDNPAIHEDYRKILAGRREGADSAAEAALFGEQQADTARPGFDMDSAMQGRDGVELARARARRGPPVLGRFRGHANAAGLGRAGDRSRNLWKIDPEIQVVICSAYSDYDWMELLARLGHSDKLIVIKKPFEPIEILQSASALSRKWQNARALKRHVEGLELVVTDRTRGLEAANRQLGISLRTTRSPACPTACCSMTASPRRLPIRNATHMSSRSLVHGSRPIQAHQRLAGPSGGR